PSTVTPSSAAARQTRSRSGWAGLPSSRTIAAPRSSPETSMFQTTQLVLPTTSSRSPGRRSECRPRVFRCSRTTPPWLCTMPLGTPVVPEENSTQSGWSNGTGSAVHSWSPATTSSQEWWRTSGAGTVAGRGRSQQADHRLDPVGQHGDDAVAVPHAPLPQEGRERTDLPAQLRPAGRAAIALLVERDDGLAVAGQRAGGVVDRRLGEPTA